MTPMMLTMAATAPLFRSLAVTNATVALFSFILILSYLPVHSLTSPNALRTCRASSRRFASLTRTAFCVEGSPPTLWGRRTHHRSVWTLQERISSTEDDIDSLLHGDDVVITTATTDWALHAKKKFADDELVNHQNSTVDASNDKKENASSKKSAANSTTLSSSVTSPPLPPPAAFVTPATTSKSTPAPTPATHAATSPPATTTATSPPATTSAASPAPRTNSAALANVTTTSATAAPKANSAAPKSTSAAPPISPIPPPPVMKSPPPPPSPPPTPVTKFATPTSRATTTTTTSANPAAIEPVGIGGKGGLVYDVNRLKRNLLQETLRAYKRELWELLSSASSVEEEIVNKLAALVQASPVSTTTDSNLLDGDWVLAYRSKQNAFSDLLDPRRFARANRMKRKTDPTTAVLTTERVKLPRPFQGIKGGIFRTLLRTYTLEDVDDPRAPYIIDTWRLFGGLAMEKRFYSLTGLSRSNLDMDLLSTEWFLFGGEAPIHNVTYSVFERPREEVQVLYSDVDLCITSEDGGPDSPFLVYTKNEAWLDRKKRFRRKLRFVLNGFGQIVKMVLPIDWIQRRFFSNTLDLPEDSSKILLQVKQGNSSVRVLKLGSTTEDEVAWDGEMDPFVHMSADERQVQLRAMNVRQIDRAQRRQQAKARRERLVKWLVRRKTFFKKPESK